LIRALPAEAGVTVFLSSHLLAEVEQIATHLGIVRSGRLLFEGTPEALRAERRGAVALGVDRPAEVAELLAGCGWTAAADGEGRVRVAVEGRDEAALLNRRVVEAGFAVHALTPEGASLESIFLDLTRTEALHA